MKKKLTAVIASVCALAILAIGSTFAFFSSTDNAGNTFTMGNLQITLTETSTADEANGIKAGVVADDGKAVEYDGALPGDVYSKVPVVANTGANDSWIRVSLNVEAVAADASTEDAAAYAADLAALKAAIVADMVASGDWAVKDTDDGYIYLTSVLEATDPDATATLFETVSIPNTWGNECADRSFTISIDAQGVQADNNGATWDVASWTELDAAA